MKVIVDACVTLLVDLDDINCFSCIDSNRYVNLTKEEKLNVLNAVSEDYTINDMRELVSNSEVLDYEVIGYSDYVEL